ncbi:CutA1 divalent ion tolerance protein [Glomus cerebriforme]|uniref:CutA1 divalent ion tolerance protein n=1 Tax=Glomus cerebriforme TaxID=658196 RepID=A0A397T578_9GLOM|nr:CutA1 divalent ion tolerance protein [Glomus cerebriforme]
MIPSLLRPRRFYQPFRFSESRPFTLRLFTFTLLLTHLSPRLFSTTSGCAAPSLKSVMESAAESRIIFVTCPNEELALKLSRGLLQEKLVACVKIIPKVTSLYWWEGKIEESADQLLMIKTLEKHVAEITDYVNKNHDYTVPEVLSVKVDGGNESYLKWIKDSVKP